MRVSKVIAIPALGIALLAGSTFGVLAQDEAGGATAQDVVFAVVSSARTHGGEFTTIGDIPGGTVKVAEGSQASPEMIVVTYILDPDPPGGDTITLRENGGRASLFDGGAGYTFTTWAIQPGSGTGEYERLAGKGRSITIGDPETLAIHSFFSGSIDTASE